MRKVTVVQASEVEIKPFVWDDFTGDKETHSTLKQVNKKELKVLAKELGLDYDDENIAFAKKLINAYIKRSV